MRCLAWRTLCGRLEFAPTHPRAAPAGGALPLFRRRVMVSLGPLARMLLLRGGPCVCGVPCECVALAAVDGDAVGRCSCVGCRRRCALASLRSRSCCCPAACRASASLSPLSTAMPSGGARASAVAVAVLSLRSLACVRARFSRHRVGCRRRQRSSRLAPPRKAATAAARLGCRPLRRCASSPRRRLLRSREGRALGVARHLTLRHLTLPCRGQWSASLPFVPGLTPGVSLGGLACPSDPF